MNEAQRSILETLRQLEQTHEDVLLLAVEDTPCRVHRETLEKMTAMGLEALPISCVAVPVDSDMLAGEPNELKATADYSRRLSAYFQVFFVAALYELQSLMLRFDVKAYVVGGITRDLLLMSEKRQEVQDVDITVEGDALAFVEFLAENSRNFTIVERYPEFGTAKVQYKNNLMFDFASTRQEVYSHCGALPVVVKRGVPLADDVIRRDFTINALAFSIHELGQVLDYTHGIRDIELELIRVLHPASFFEDPSRVLRAMKFCARFDFRLADETRQLLLRFLDVGGRYYKGGGERIKQELKGFLGVEESPAKSRYLELFIREGCYRLINMEADYTPEDETIGRFVCIPDLLPTVRTALSAYIHPEFSFDVYLCFLCRDMPEDVYQETAQRLGLTRDEREFSGQFRRLRDVLLERFRALHDLASPAEIYDLFQGLHLVTVSACLIELGFVDPGHMETVLEAFLKYKRKWESLRLELDGNDLIALGVPEGKVIGQVLDQLLHAKLAGQAPDRLGEVQYVQNRLNQFTESEPDVHPPAL